ncbi:MAG: hypothetical protein ACRDSN_00295 [Pseudonocardiaceae bacterium]
MPAGHPGVLAQLRRYRAGTINGLGLLLQRRFERDLDPAALRRRTAAVVLSLATGPHRVQEREWRANTRRRILPIPVNSGGSPCHAWS